MNDKMALPKWCDKTVTEKILFTAQILLSVFTILLASLQIFDIWVSIDIVPLLFGGVMLLMFLQNKKYSKVISYIYLGTAIFIFYLGFDKFLM